MANIKTQNRIERLGDMYGQRYDAEVHTYTGSVHLSFLISENANSGSPCEVSRN